MNGAIPSPRFSLENNLSGRLPSVRGKVLAALRGKTPQRAFEEPADEGAKLLVVGTTNDVVAKVTGGSVKAHERQVAYESFLMSRFIASELIGRKPQLQPEDFCNVLRPLSGSTLVSTSEEYFSERVSLRVLTAFCIARISNEGRYIQSAHVVAGMSLRLIEQQEASINDEIVAEFRDQLQIATVDDGIVEEFRARLIDVTPDTMINRWNNPDQIA